MNAKEIECLLYDNHQEGKMMIMIVKTPGSQVDSPIAEGNRKKMEKTGERGGKKSRGDAPQGLRVTNEKQV